MMSNPLLLTAFKEPKGALVVSFLDMVVMLLVIFTSATCNNCKSCVVSFGNLGNQMLNCGGVSVYFICNY